MPVPDRRIPSAAFLHQQNLMRGAFGRLKRRGFDDLPQHPSLTYRTDVREVLMGARTALDVAEYEEFIEWFERRHGLEAAPRLEGGAGFDFLNGVIFGTPLPLGRELAWVSARLAAGVPELRRFKAAADDVELCCVKGHYREASAILSRMVAAHGETMWSVQLRIALEHRTGGLEAQKAYLEAVRSRFRQGILAYVAYNTSVRNEDRTSWPRFSEGVRNSSGRRSDRALGDYLAYRLLDEWPGSEEGMAGVLRIEQSHSLPDVYETFVAFCQECVIRDDLARHRPAAKAAA